MRPFVSSALPLLSASQITLFRECARKWAFRYIAGLKTPLHPSAAFGIEVDDTQLQPYLRDGRPFDFTRDSGYVAASGLRWLPKPQAPGLEVQKHFILPSRDGRFAYQGYKDLWLPDSSMAPEMPGGVPCVIDFKTTSDLKWAKSVTVLSTDVQAMLYAANAIHETGTDEVDLGWIYFQTKGPRKSRRTYLRVTRDHVSEQMFAIEKTASELFDAKVAAVDPLSLPPTPSQCEAFGGCPFRDKCNLSPVDYVEALQAQSERRSSPSGKESMDNTESLLTSLAARKGKVSAEAVGEALAPKPKIVEFEVEIPATALGINPPEKDLPPPAPAPVKRGPGRPKKEAVAEVLPGQMPLPFDGLDYDRLAAKTAGLVLDQLAVMLIKARGV